jgi:hypothetical protein
MPSWILMSWGVSVRDRCTVIPGRRRSHGTVTWTLRGQRFAKPHSASAEPWLSAAPAPQARTPAAASSTLVRAGFPTE